MLKNRLSYEFLENGSKFFADIRYLNETNDTGKILEKSEYRVMDRFRMVQDLSFGSLLTDL